MTNEMGSFTRITIEMKVIKISDEQMALVGATTAEEFPAKLTAFAAEAERNKTAMANQPDFKSFEDRIAKLETGALTEARVGEILGASVSKAVADFSASDAGKKVIGAEASRITMEALANVGTTPAKSSPAPSEPAASGAKDLISAGKYEEAFAASPELQAEFPSAKHFATYQKAQVAGRVNFAKVQRPANN